MRAILLTAFAALSTLFGGWLALRARKHIHLLLGFGAGVLLGATFFDLLPEAIDAAGQGGLTSREILGLTVVPHFRSCKAPATVAFAFALHLKVEVGKCFREPRLRSFSSLL